MSDQDNLLRRAEQVFPGGVLGSHRSGPVVDFGGKEGRGASLWAVNGRRYFDYPLGSGPMRLGHAHPAVVEAVERQIARGTSSFLLNEPAIQLAEEIVKAVPCAEQVRYTSSGSEATFFALRVARAFRKRDKIMKFEGGFHGTHDYALMSVVPRSPKAFPAPMMDSAGVPHALEAEVLIAPYNDLATAEALIASHHDELAAVLIEPYQRTIVPAPGFLAGLAAAARKHGVPAQVSGEPPVFDIFFTDREVVDYRATLVADRDRIKRFNQELVRRKIVKAVNKIYVSLAHTDKDVAETIEIFDQALAVIAAGA